MLSLARLRWKVLVVAVATSVGLVACAEIFGFKDGVYTPDGSIADGGADVVDAAPDYVFHDAFTVDVNTAYCDGAVPAVDAAIWVSNVVTGAADNAACGTTSEPCLTITFALARAVDGGVKTVYVDRSTFLEALAMNGATYSGFTIQGGWTVEAGTWTPNCDSTYSKIIAPEGGPPMTVSISGVGSPGVTLRLLEVHTKDPDKLANAESRYAVMVNDSDLTLDNVTLIAQPGSPGAFGANTPPALNCAAVAGSGANGDGGAPGPVGTYGAGGYVTAAGGMGSSGSAGGATWGEGGACSPGCVVKCQ